MLTLINWLFGCSHKHTSRLFTLPLYRGSTTKHTYKVCFDCGKEIEYNLDTYKPIKTPTKKVNNAHRIILFR